MNLRAQRVLLESAARTSTTTASQISDATHTSVRLYLNVTAGSGTGGLTLKLRGYDKASGNAAVIFQDASAITATGLYVFEIAPSIAASDSHRRAALQAYLPVVWDVQVAHGDSSSYTYSLSAETTS